MVILEQTDFGYPCQGQSVFLVKIGVRTVIKDKQVSVVFLLRSNLHVLINCPWSDGGSILQLFWICLYIPKFLILLLFLFWVQAVFIRISMFSMSAFPWAPLTLSEQSAQLGRSYLSQSKAVLFSWCHRSLWRAPRDGFASSVLSSSARSLPAGNSAVSSLPRALLTSVTLKKILTKGHVICLLAV